MTNEPTATTAPLFQPIKGASPPERAYRYRSLTPYTWAVTGLGAANMLAVAFAIVVQAGLLEAYPPASTPLGAAAIFMVLTLLPTYIAGGFWIYNAACNARALGARGLHTSPGWAVGWYFIPIMALFRPFQAMEEIDQASGAPGAWASERTPMLLRWWWAAWLIAGFVDRAATFVPSVPVLSLIDSILSLVSVGLFLAVVWRIYRRQASTRASLSNVAEVFA